MKYDTCFCCKDIIKDFYDDRVEIRRLGRVVGHRPPQYNTLSFHPDCFFDAAGEHYQKALSGEICQEEFDKEQEQFGTVSPVGTNPYIKKCIECSGFLSSGTRSYLCFTCTTVIAPRCDNSAIHSQSVPGQHMFLKRNSRDGTYFFSCPSWPTCRRTKDYKLIFNKKPSP